MANLTYLRLAAREIFDNALKAVDSYAAVRRAVRLENAELSIRDSTLNLRPDRPIYSIAMGKAAMPMATALEEVLGKRLVEGIVSTSDRYRTPTRRDNPRINETPSNSRHRFFNGGHPQPNGESIAAGVACFEMLERANDGQALVFFSISGGGSAMTELPVGENITLADLQLANELLINCGASIGEINAVRRAFSAVKGGRLAARARNCDQITLIVSDVPSNEEQNVASGPTFAPISDGPSAQEVVSRYGLRTSLPESIVRIIDADQQPVNLTADDSPLLRRYFVLLDNRSAQEAAAQAARDRNLHVEVDEDIVDQSIEAGSSELVKRLMQIKPESPQRMAAALISGGEFSCPVRGPGAGGRNLETALRLALEWEKRNQRAEQRPFTALCAGTDGIDGNSPAAGAIVDHTTISRARAIGLNAEEFLMRSDSYSFFVALGDAITTGATGTNVRDLRILLTGEN